MNNINYENISIEYDNNNENQIKYVLDIKPKIEIEKDIFEIVKYINTKEMKKLEKENNQMYLQHIFTKFNIFAERYYGLLDLILTRDKKNMEMIFMLLNQAEKVRLNNGENVDEIEKEVATTLNDIYIYPKYADKDGKNGKENFERKCMEKK